jgi:hypothetical protein
MQSSTWFQSSEDFIRTPLAQLAMGGVIFYGTQRFFKEVEEKLNEDTKLRISVLLLDVKAAPMLEPWRDAFRLVVDDVLNKTQRRRKPSQFLLIVILSLWAVLCQEGVWHTFKKTNLEGFGNEYLFWLLCIFLAATCSNYLSLSIFRPLISLRWEERRLKLLDALATKTTGQSGREEIETIVSSPLRKLEIKEIIRCIFFNVSFAAAACVVWQFILGTAVPGSNWLYVHIASLIIRPWLHTAPAFMLPILAILYLAFGIVFKTVMRFDSFFTWFTNTFDIEKKPLQSLGIGAGTLLALAYWAIVVVSRVT